MIQIVDLSLCKEHVDQLAEWHGSQWLHSGPDRRALVLSRTSAGRIPKTFVALRDGKPAGLVCLIEKNLPWESGMGPWLASLYVDHEHRRQGIGEMLVAHCERHAATAGYGELFLYTSSAIEYYKRLDWQEISRATIFQSEKTIMKKDLRHESKGEVTGDSFFIEDTASDAVRATSKGIEVWGVSFACAGYDIRRIKRRHQLKMALRASEPFILEEIIREFEERGKHNPDLLETAEGIRRILDRPAEDS